MEMVWDWNSIGSLPATLVFLRSATCNFLPAEARHFLHDLFARLLTAIRPTDSIVIEEYDASRSDTNDLFDAARSHLSSRCLATAAVLHLSKPRNSGALTSSLPSSHALTDDFQGIPLRWCFHSVDRPASSSFSPSASTERRSLELSFHRCHYQAVHNQYIPHLLDKVVRLRLKSCECRLYANRYISADASKHHNLWSCVPFAHPSTFDTLAINPALRDDVIADLRRFTTCRNYYARAGRVWKQGYLLHGPPGTGKTSLIAAIASFLEFDVYDLDLTAVTSNSHLRKLLVSIFNKSVIVLEDVDCSLDLSDRSRKKRLNQVRTEPDADEAETAGPFSVGYGGTTVSLSGVLNFIDGLWSSCVGERLMVFTTNHPERLDPALLRPGRMDRRIHLSYCGPAAFRTLARNYLEVGKGHPLMDEAEALLGEVSITPAEVAEVFMGCDGDGADVGMQRAVEEMRRRKAEAKEE